MRGSGRRKLRISWATLNRDERVEFVTLLAYSLVMLAVAAYAVAAGLGWSPRD